MTKEEFFKKLIDTDFMSTVGMLYESTDIEHITDFKSYYLGAAQFVHDVQERKEVEDTFERFEADYFTHSKCALRSKYCRSNSSTLDEKKIRMIVHRCKTLFEEQYKEVNKKEFILGLLEFNYSLSGNELDLVLEILEKEL